MQNLEIIPYENTPCSIIKTCYTFGKENRNQRQFGSFDFKINLSKYLDKEFWKSKAFQLLVILSSFGK